MELISIYSLTNHSQKNWEICSREKSTANRENTVKKTGKFSERKKSTANREKSKFYYSKSTQKE